MSSRLFLVGLLLGAACFSNAATVSFNGLVLLQPDFVLQERISDVNSLAAFTQREEQLFQQIIAQEKLPPSAGYMVLAVRSKNQVNVWFDIQPALPKTVEAKLKREIRKSVGIPVSGGTVLVAHVITINGAKAPVDKPNPKEWRDAAKSYGTVPIEVEMLVNRIWK